MGTGSVHPSLGSKTVFGGGINMVGEQTKIIIYVTITARWMKSLFVLFSFKLFLRKEKYPDNEKQC